jgi:hypothetical protein
MAFMTNGFEHLSGWTATGTTATEFITACGTNRIYGGYGVFGAGAASTVLIMDLTPHYSVTI